MATQLSRTFSSQGNQRKFTISVWVKRSKIGATQSIMGSGGSGAYATHMYFDSNDVIDFWNWFNSAYQGRKITNRKFRDTHGFYHIVFRVDTTSATASERMRIYINGEETSFATNDAPSQNQTFEIGHTGAHYIGGYGSGANYEGDMILSHFHYCDGQSYAPTEFGETDSTTGIWKPKTSPSVSYGTSGVFLDFANSSAMGNDVSGLNNDWTADSNLKQCLTTPSNIFCTFNGVGDAGGDHSFLAGGTGVAFQETSGDARVYGNLAFSKGKYYWEWKAISEHPSANTWGIGSVDDLYNQESPGGNNKHWVMNAANKYNGSATSYGSQVNIGEIGMVAVDMDNDKIWFGKDGTWFGSGNPSTGANPAFSNVTDVTVTPIAADNTSTYTPQQHYNFGEGRFGTTAVASAGTNSGIGTFEFDVPTGFKALCTKNLNEQEYS